MSASQEQAPAMSASQEQEAAALAAELVTVKAETAELKAEHARQVLIMEVMAGLADYARAEGVEIVHARCYM